MAESMEKVPEPAYYSYNIVRGMLCLPTGYLWHPNNPNYDPGPPPPPRVPKDDAAQEGKGKGRGKGKLDRVPQRVALPGVAGWVAGYRGQLPSSSASVGLPQQPNRRRNHHSGDEDSSRGGLSLGDRVKRARVGDAANGNNSMYVRTLRGFIRNRI